MGMDCLFCKIIQGDIACQEVYRDDRVMAFRDIAPQAPSHLLIIPLKHIATLNDANENEAMLLGHMIITAKKLADKEGISKDGYRLVYNVHAAGGQTVFHVHLHLLGGRQLQWPPG